MTLLPITAENHGVTIDLRYATPDNLTGAPIYRRADAYLHPDAAAALGRAVDLARPLGLRFRVYDVFRPPEAQWLLWKTLPDARFVADPRRGSAHGRGVAIDLTLETPNGDILDMGTGFDEMAEASRHSSISVPAAAQRNRRLLLGLMIAAGWAHYDPEWWHFNLPDPERYPLLSDSVLDRPMVA